MSVSLCIIIRGKYLSLFQFCGSRKQRLPKKSKKYLDWRVLRFETGFNSSVNEFPVLWTSFQEDCSLRPMPSAGCSSDESLQGVGGIAHITSFFTCFVYYDCTLPLPLVHPLEDLAPRMECQHMENWFDFESEVTKSREAGSRQEWLMTPVMQIWSQLRLPPAPSHSNAAESHPSAAGLERHQPCQIKCRHKIKCCKAANAGGRNHGLGEATARV